jgi:hypothetical protein
MNQASDFWDAIAPYHSEIENDYFDLRSLRRIIHESREPVLVVGADQGLIVAELKKRGFQGDGVDFSAEVITLKSIISVVPTVSTARTRSPIQHLNHSVSFD